MYISAQINKETKICYAVIRSTELIKTDNSIQIESYDISILGKKWNGSSWEEVPLPTPEEPTT